MCFTDKLLYGSRFINLCVKLIHWCLLIIFQQIKLSMIGWGLALNIGCFEIECKLRFFGNYNMYYWQCNFVIELSRYS